MSVLAAVARWMIAVPAGLLFSLCVIGNWSLLLGLVLGRIKSTSLILPFLGPAFGLVFLFSVPIAGVARFWWVVPLAEPTWLLGLWYLIAAGITRFGRCRDS
jgi:hypothetical protein